FTENGNKTRIVKMCPCSDFFTKITLNSDQHIIHQETESFVNLLKKQYKNRFNMTGAFTVLIRNTNHATSPRITTCRIQMD
ncbi:hypothetical protein, partial [Salmonella sp. s51090]|uniref:hypothetical protein n=1 Tax=Salmonella sp. s51090 TaxID=3159651 RepID=UPI00397F73CA